MIRLGSRPDPEITRFRCDCLAEQGGLETPVSREVFPKETPRNCLRNFLSRDVQHQAAIRAAGPLRDHQVGLPCQQSCESPPVIII